MLGVSTDTTAQNKSFREKFSFPYDLLSDVDGAMSTAYGAVSEAGARASRVSVLIGPDGRVARVYEKVKPADHADEVLNHLE